MIFKAKHKSPIDSLPFGTIFDRLTLGALSRCVLFGGGSSSKSKQKEETKDNKQLLEDEATAATDISQADVFQRTTGTVANDGGRIESTEGGVSGGDFSAGDIAIEQTDAGLLDATTAIAEQATEQQKSRDKVNEKIVETSGELSEKSVENAFAFGSENVDALKQTSEDAFDFGEEAIESSEKANISATEAIGEFGGESLKFVGDQFQEFKGLVQDSINFAEEQSKQGSDIAEQTNAQFRGFLENLTPAPESTVEREGQGNILAAVAILAAAFVLSNGE